MSLPPTPLLVAAAAAVALATGFRSAPSAPNAPAPRIAGTFEVDPVHSTVIFRIRHMDVSYSYGRFNGISGTFTTGGDDPSEATVHVEIDAQSVDTGNSKRDEHLKSPDFFNAVQYPKITFDSKRVVAKGEDTYTVTGDLSFHGETREVTIDMTKVGERDAGERMGYRAGFEGTFTLDRSDFGVSTYPADVLGEDVRVTVSLEGVKE